MLLLRSIQQQSIEEVFEELIGKEAFQNLKKSLGAKCLIILEGFDEITFERKQRDNFLMKLIDSKLLQYSTIVVTSRPYACQELMIKANKIIEILGFGEKEIREFVQDLFAVDNTKSDEVFLQKLEENPQLYSICHVPISLAMIVDIFKETKSLPLTLTELYYRFIVMVLVRESKKLTERNQVSLDVTLSSNDEKILHLVHLALPDIPEQKLKTIFLLSKLAFHGFFSVTDDNESGKQFKIIGQKIIFIEDDLIQCGIVNTNHFDGHSLLKMETVHHFAGGQITFNFIHLTVQEFLSAVYMLTLSQNEQYHLFQKCFKDYPNILMLYFGLTRIDFHEVVYPKLKSPSSIVTAMKCLYENQRTTSPQQSTPPFVLRMNGNTLLPYDCICLSYICMQYPVTKLILERCWIGDKNAEIFAKQFSNRNYTTKFEKFVLHENDLTFEGMQNMMKMITSELNYQLFLVIYFMLRLQAVHH